MSDDLSPYTRDELDELLSAEIDGELDAAARDLGVSVDEVNARLRATPGTDDRRAALAAARDLMAVPPEIDELVAQRLRAKAVRVAVDEHADRDLDRRRRRRQMLLGAGAIAAATVAVVALAGGLNGNGSTTNSASEKSTSASPAADTNGAAGSTAVLAPVALGAFTDTHELAARAVSHATSPSPRRVAAGALSPTTSATPALGVTQDHPGAVPSNIYAQSGSTAPSAAKSANGAGTGKQLALVPAACPTPKPVRSSDKLVLRGTATLSGKPVVVFVFAGGGEHSIKIEAADCRVLAIEMLR